MKRIKIFLVLFLASLSAYAQMTSLNENFNSSFCPSQGSYYPGGWTEQNFNSPHDSLSWRCTPTNGENGTGGMFCTGHFNNLNHLDTAYLITPLLDISSYTSNVYMQFDSKTDNFSAVTLAFMASPDSTLNSADSSFSGSKINPALSSNDQAGWITHQVDITDRKGSPFFFAFRYTSSTALGNIWYLDNVLLTGTQLDVTNIQKGIIPLTIIGRSTSDQIKFSYKANQDGMYDLAIFDILGREVHKQTLYIQTSSFIYTINGLNLQNGMYFIKLANSNTYSTVKTIVQ